MFTDATACDRDLLVRVEAALELVTCYSTRGSFHERAGRQGALVNAKQEHFVATAYVQDLREGLACFRKALQYSERARQVFERYLATRVFQLCQMMSRDLEVVAAWIAHQIEWILRHIDKYEDMTEKFLPHLQAAKATVQQKRLEVIDRAGGLRKWRENARPAGVHAEQYRGVLQACRDLE